MKIITLSAFFLLYAITGLFAQNTYPWPSNNDVGIGTTTPHAKLDVEGELLLLPAATKMYIKSGYSFDASMPGIRCNFGSMVINSKDNGTVYINRDVYAETHIQAAVGTNSYDIAVFKPNGSVGIGTSNTNDAAYKLFVETGIRTRKIKVDQDGWPDYVFNRNYHLRPLNEIEKFIRQYQHLPDVPSAAEVKNEGIDLGANQAVLLEKIEELTLYLIEQQKQMDELRRQVQDLQKGAAKNNDK